MDFWIDEYNEELEHVLDMALKVSRGEIDKEVAKQFRSTVFAEHTVVGLIRMFCEIVMTFDLMSLNQHDGRGLSGKISTFFFRVQHSNFTNHDANTLAAVVTHLTSSNEALMAETEAARSKYAETDLTFNFSLVHPKIMMIARNLHPQINKLYLEW